MFSGFLASLYQLSEAAPAAASQHASWLCHPQVTARVPTAFLLSRGRQPLLPLGLCLHVCVREVCFWVGDTCTRGTWQRVTVVLGGICEQEKDVYVPCGCLCW